MPIFADHVTDIADILTSTAEDGEIRVSLGDVRTGDGYDSNAAVWGPDGYLARPNAQGDGATRALFIVDGNARRVIATTDRRFSAQAGTLEPGDRMLVTDAACRLYMKRARAQVGMYTEASDEPPVGGKGMILDLDGEGSVIQLRFGGTMIVLDGKTVTIVAAGAASSSSITLSETAITLTAPTINVAGGFVALGLNSDGTIPGKPGVDTVIIGSQGSVGIASKSVFAAQY